MTDPKAVLEEFCTICERAWMDFELYRSLREAGDSDLCLYYATAPLFFHDVNDILIGHLFVQFAKITDPASSGKGRDNLTSNYILEAGPWTDATRAKLKSANDRLMAFRGKIEAARNKRLAHTDLNAQMTRMAEFGAFNKGEDQQFLNDLQEFVNIAATELIGAVRSIEPAMATDTHQLVRALQKGVLYDGCKVCDDKTRTNAILGFK